MLGGLAFSHLLMLLAITLLDYHFVLWIGKGNWEERKKEGRGIVPVHRVRNL
jgi:hypothetical protein